MTAENILIALLYVVSFIAFAVASVLFLAWMLLLWICGYEMEEDEI